MDLREIWCDIVYRNMWLNLWIVAGCFEQGDEPMSSTSNTEVLEVLDQLSDQLLVTQLAASWSEFFTEMGYVF